MKKEMKKNNLKNDKKVPKKMKNLFGVKLIDPLQIKFKLKDFLQVAIGASILAIPVGFTQETWELAEIIPLKNIILFTLLSIFLIGTFIYYHYYRRYGIKEHIWEFTKRVVFTYFVSFVMVSILLTLIDKAPWKTNMFLAIKRIILVNFPASMSGTIADTIK